MISMQPFSRARLDPLLVFLRRRRPMFSLGSLVMYALALVAELPVILARFLLTTVAAIVVLELQGHPNGNPSWAQLALIPTAWSMLAMLTPVGSAWWWRTRAGGRDPSTREQVAYDDAVELLQAHSTRPLALPARWFVLDIPQPDAAVCGNALMLSRGLLESEALPAVLAHELGHLATPDWRLTAALNRLVVFSSPLGPTAEEQRERPRERRRVEEPEREARDDAELLWRGMLLVLRVLAKIAVFAKGGFGLRVTGPILGRYWRQREYKADEYTASLGQADELADFLEIHALIHDHPVPFIWLSEHTHPPAELRIDRLLSLNPPSGAYARVRPAFWVAAEGSTTPPRSRR
jgi:Zn-dependent protease with chaperone function